MPTSSWWPSRRWPTARWAQRGLPPPRRTPAHVQSPPGGCISVMALPGLPGMRVTFLRWHILTAGLRVWITSPHRWSLIPISVPGKALTPSTRSSGPQHSPYLAPMAVDVAVSASTTVAAPAATRKVPVLRQSGCLSKVSIHLPTCNILVTIPWYFTTIPQWKLRFCVTSPVWTGRQLTHRPVVTRLSAQLFSANLWRTHTLECDLWLPGFC